MRHWSLTNLVFGAAVTLLGGAVIFGCIYPSVWVSILLSLPIRACGIVFGLLLGFLGYVLIVEELR